MNVDSNKLQMARRDDRNMAEVGAGMRQLAELDFTQSRFIGLQQLVVLRSRFLQFGCPMPEQIWVNAFFKGLSSSHVEAVKNFLITSPAINLAQAVSSIFCVEDGKIVASAQIALANALSANIHTELAVVDTDLKNAHDQALQACPFLAMPEELIAMTLRQVCVSPRPVVLKTRSSRLYMGNVADEAERKSWQAALAAIGTNRQLHRIGTKIIYGENLFVGALGVLLKFTMNLAIPDLQCLRHIAIDPYALKVHGYRSGQAINLLYRLKVALRVSGVELKSLSIISATNHHGNFRATCLLEQYRFEGMIRDLYRHNVLPTSFSYDANAALPAITSFTYQVPTGQTSNVVCNIYTVFGGDAPTAFFTQETTLMDIRIR